MAANTLRNTIEHVEKINLVEDIEKKRTETIEKIVVLSHFLSEITVNCASAAYTASIQHFERECIQLVIEICFSR